MPNRILKESICTSDTIAELSDFEYRLWTGLILIADDVGRGDARAAVIKGRVFPLRERVTVKDIDAGVHGLAAKGCVSLYEVDGKPYFWFPTWRKHQRVRDVKPKYPAPPGEEEYSLFDASPQIAADRGDLPLESESESESESNFTVSDETVCRTDVQRVVDAWNTLGLTKVTRLGENTSRNAMLKARLREYGLDAVLQAVEKVRNSRFLNGNSRNGWTITFDWFVRPNNFPKVLEGNYDDPEKPKLDQRAYDGAKWLASVLAKRMEGYVMPQAAELDRWAADLNELHHIGYTWKQISDTALWAVNDDFWGPQIVSGEALRKNFTKLLAKRGDEA